MNVYSPMATGNGAYVVHSMLNNAMPNYHLQGYNPYLTLAPFLLPCIPLKNEKPDIIHSTPDYAFFFKQKKIPLIITFHNYVLDSGMKVFSSFLQRIHYSTDLKYFTLKALEHASIVTSVSKYTASLVKKDLDFDGDIKVIYNGIDTKSFAPKTKKTEKKIKILFSGNLTRRKGAHLITSIANRLDKNIVIQYTKGLRTKASLPDAPNLENIGSVPYHLIPEVYKQADILLFPTFREGFGLAAAEAMACGLPVVATNCSSLPELIIDGKGGYLCEFENVDEFAGKINELANSPKKRKEMGEFNRERVVENFSLGKMIEEYKNLFKSIV